MKCRRKWKIKWERLFSVKGLEMGYNEELGLYLLLHAWCTASEFPETLASRITDNRLTGHFKATYRNSSAAA